MLKQIILANANDWALNFRKVVQQQISGEVVTLILASSTLLFWIKSERITITGLRLPVIVKIKKWYNLTDTVTGHMRTTMLSVQWFQVAKPLKHGSHIDST